MHRVLFSSTAVIACWIQDMFIIVSLSLETTQTKSDASVMDSLSTIELGVEFDFLDTLTLFDVVLKGIETWTVFYTLI